MSNEKNTSDINTAVQELEQQLADETDPYRQLELLNAFCGKVRYGSPELAYTYAVQMFEIAEALQDKFWMARALYAQVTYEVFYVYRDSQFVIDKLLRAEQLFEETGYIRWQAKIWDALATEYGKQGDYSSARNMSEKAMVIFEQIGDKKNYANCKSYLGLIDSHTGRLPQALEGLMAALVLYQEIEDIYGQSSCYSGLGAVYMELRDYPRAISNYSQSLELVRQLGQPMVEALGMQNLANAYMEIGEVESALQNYTHAQQVFHQLGYYNREGLTWTQIGDIYVDRYEYTTALECYQQAETLFGLAEEQDVQRDIVYLYHCLSGLYIKQEQWGEARDYLHKALEKAEKIQFRTEEQLLHERLSEVCERLDDTRQALYHYKKYTELKDEILDQEKQKVITEMQAKFDVETAEREKELFRVKNVELSAALEEVHRLNDRLTKLNSEKNAVLSVVAHDLKSPLSGVKMVSSLLKSHYEQMPKEELYHQLDTIEQTSERMLTIATSLLKAQTLEDGGLYDTIAPVDVVALVSSVVDRYCNAAAQKNIHVVIEQVGGVQEVLCNREGLEQVVENLVSNAVKFTPSGRNVFIRVKGLKRGVSVEVEDEGPGISRRDRSRLFGKFARLSAQPTGGESTTGLGLWIAKQTMLAMGGDIRYVSKQGTGALFRVSLRQPVVHNAKKNAQTA